MSFLFKSKPKKMNSPFQPGSEEVIHLSKTKGHLLDTLGCVRIYQLVLQYEEDRDEEPPSYSDSMAEVPRKSPFNRTHKQPRHYV